LSIFESKHIHCMHLDEAMAEKVRAWLTRQEPAIRDFFDVRHAKNQWYDFHKIKELIYKKVEEARKIYTLESNYNNLKKQIDTDLRPVLWISAWDFDFDQIYAYILSFKH
jgi:predicted nucleotidyltransferase component of viral defense system